MNLKLYNEWLVAIVGTVGPLAILALTAWNELPHGNPVRPVGVVVQRAPATADSKSKPQQVLAQCAPVFGDESEWQYIPLASFLIGNGDDNAHVGPYYMEMRTAFDSQVGNALDTCIYSPGPSRHVIFNMLVRRGGTDDQRLLFHKPVVLSTLILPDVKCATGDGRTPCGTLIWTLYDEDTNNDGVIDYRDARQLYVSDLAGQNLRRLSPSSATVLDWKWHAHTRELFIVVRRITRQDSKGVDDDDAELFVAKGDLSAAATPVIESSILNTLQGVLR